MLSSRRVQTNQGKLTVEVAHPRGAVMRRLVRQLPLKVGLYSALAGFLFSSYQHSAGHRPERGAAAMRALTGETATWGVAGGMAGFTGAVVYGLMEGPVGVVVAVTAAALVAGSTHQALPALADAQQKLGRDPLSPISLDGASYAPVLVDATFKEETPPPAPAYHGPFNDRIVFLGMNPASTLQATRLLKRHADVTVITDNPDEDHITWGGHRYDLRTDAGAAQFVRSLNLPVKNAQGVERAFHICEPLAKDELAGLTLIWARGEKGAYIPSRLVLAGHSNGDGVWGDNNGSLRLGPLLELSQALPHASAQIKDAFVTGCYSGGEVTMDQYLLIFPNARSIWAYEAQAPGVDNGAAVDEAGFERCTRGTNEIVPPLQSASAGKNFAIWNYQSGYHALKPMLTTDQLRGKVEWMEEHFFRPAMAGQDYTWDHNFKIPLRVNDPHTGLIRQYYSWLVRLTQQSDLPEEERPLWVAKKYQAIRFLYFSESVAPRFCQHYGAAIHAGYTQLGLATPDFTHLDRAQSLAQVDLYLKKLDRTRNPSAQSEQVGTLLERGVKDLDPGMIPDGWV